MSTVAIQTPTDTVINAQGSILDPIQIKKSSAAKMRLADKTGNVALRKEAAAEQSFADRLGGRTALLSDELKRQIQLQKEANGAGFLEAPKEEEVEKKEGETKEGETKEEATTQDAQPQQEKRQRRNRKKKQQDQTESGESQEQSTSADPVVPRQHAPLKPTSQPFQPGQKVAQAPAQPTQMAQVQETANALSIPFNTVFSNGTITLPPEAIILKLDAASKQSIADKTGNLVLKRTAALEQSLADKMAFVSAPGITTTALRAGRKGFMLDPLFQLQAIGAVQTPAAQPAAPAQPQEEKKEKKQKQKQQQPQAEKTQKHVQIQLPTEQPQQKQVKQMRHSSSLNNVPQQTQQKPQRTMQHSKSMGSVHPVAPSRSDNLDWRKPNTESVHPFPAHESLQMRKQRQTGTEQKTQTTQTTPAEPKQTDATKRSGTQYRAKNNKTEEQRLVIDDLAKIKQQIADVIAPHALTPATASM